jgi:hypothetical protein
MEVICFSGYNIWQRFYLVRDRGSHRRAARDMFCRCRRVATGHRVPDAVLAFRLYFITLWAILALWSTSAADDDLYSPSFAAKASEAWLAMMFPRTNSRVPICRHCRIDRYVFQWQNREFGRNSRRFARDYLATTDANLKDSGKSNWHPAERAVRWGQIEEFEVFKRKPILLATVNNISNQLKPTKPSSARRS